VGSDVDVYKEAYDEDIHHVYKEALFCHLLCLLWDLSHIFCGRG
jgi:hypothetical protein